MTNELTKPIKPDYERLHNACVKNWCILVQMPFELEKGLTGYEGSCYVATT
jgi:hypothetical protein